MSNYTKSTNFATKDALASGNPLKIVKGAEIDTEFNNIATAVATKADLNSPTLVTPALGTPSSGTLSNCTSLPIDGGTTGTLPVSRGGTGVTTSTGSGNNVLSTSPTLVTPVLGTPTSGTLSNCTSLPIDGGTTGTLPVTRGGTGVTTSTGSGNVVLSTSPTLVTPALGTPSSGNLANCTFPTLNQNTTGTAAGLSATLAIASGGTAATTASGARTSLDVPSTSGSGATGTWGISISGNSATVSNGVYTTGSYADPAWITSIAGSKVTGNISGNAGTVTNGVYTTGTQTIGGTKTFTSGITFNDTSVQTTSAPQGAWNNLTSSRAADTSYTNSNGRAIFLSIAGVLGSGDVSSIQVDGVTIAQLGAGSSGVRLQGYCIVPKGSTYKLATSSGSAMSIAQWFEYY